MDDADLRARFNSIMTKGAKTNTYKFALAKFMLEYTDKFTESQLLNMAENNQSATVDYSDTAMEFLKYYWHQECKYRIRQNSDPNKLPYVISIIREEFDEDFAKKSFSEISDEKKLRAANRIQSRVFGKGLQKLNVEFFSSDISENDFFASSSSNSSRMMLITYGSLFGSEFWRMRYLHS